MAGETQYMRMFPLQMVLFPGISVPLHIFEERYKTMINECIELKEPFGIVLSRHADDTVPEPDPYTVGTAAVIKDVERLDEGRMNIVVEGLQRFRVIDFLKGKPYLGAIVELLEAEVPAGIEKSEIKQQVVDLFSEYIKALIGLTGNKLAGLELPDDIEVLSATVASLLAITSEDRQRLLEELDLGKALAQERDLLERQLNWLRNSVSASATTREMRPFNWQKYSRNTSLN